MVLFNWGWSIDFDHFDILASDTNRFRLLIKESLLIKRDHLFFFTEYLLVFAFVLAFSYTAPLKIILQLTFSSIVKREGTVL